MLPLLTRHLSRSLRSSPALFRPMSSAAPTFRPFNVALIQLGQVGPDKDGTS